MKKPNHLVNEKSPYLLQHAYNPVEWYPWGEKAFEKASMEDKPVFLSIGYSTCHWCHVMEKESFEDEDVANLMNEVFVNIKVDREERPDIDGIYMNVCQLLTGSGGWPLTVILTPDKKPFFAGTYFPKVTRFGRIGMLELVRQLQTAWKFQKDEINKSTAEIISALNPDQRTVAEELDNSIFESAYDDYLKKYDRSYGGFGNAPKFPSPHNLIFLLRYFKRNNDHFALEMVENTLINMREGGIYDQLGFGFHRYSTDRKWIIPHFEKMLYDQAMLASAYIETYQASGKEFYKKTAEEIFEYVLRDMTSPEGVFYSAEDADSEGEEGKFYVWTSDELHKVLNDEEYDFLSMYFRIEEGGNWIDPVHSTKNGTNILYIPIHSESSLKLSESAPKYYSDEFQLIRKKLFKEREDRIHPFKDDKVLTDWNGLMISSLAKGGAVFGNKNYTDAAERAVNFILNKMTAGDGTLFHRYRDGEAAITANLDDYAFIIQALLDLYESVFNPDYLIKALELSEIVGKLFKDENGGGFFFTPSNGEELIIKQKDIYDGAIPSGNSVLILNFLRLARFTGNTLFEEMAHSTIKAFAATIKQMPVAFSQSLVALDFALNKTFEIVIAGDPDKPETEEILNAIRKNYIPGSVIILKTDKYNDKLFKAAPFVENQKSVNNKTTVYVCSDFVCNHPVHTPEEVIELLK